MNFDQLYQSYGGALANNEPDTGTEANVKPVTQTITTDPTTGEQMMTVKGRPQDLSAANPMTPTVSMPTPASAPQTAPTPAPTAPVTPMEATAPGENPYDQLIRRLSGTQPGPQVGAQPNQAPVAQPVSAPAAQPTPQTRPVWSDIQGQEINNGAPNLNRIQPNLQQPPAPMPQPPVAPVAAVAPAGGAPAVPTAPVVPNMPSAVAQPNQAPMTAPAVQAPPAQAPKIDVAALTPDPTLRMFAKAESGGTNVPEGTVASSASGLYGITRATFDTQAAKNPALQGVTWEQFKADPKLQTTVAEGAKRDNDIALANNGLGTTPGNQYVTWFAGPSGGPALLKADANTSIDKVMSPEAIAANPTITRNPDGSLKTAGEVRQELFRRAGQQTQEQLDIVDELAKNKDYDGLVDLYKKLDSKSPEAAAVKTSLNRVYKNEEELRKVQKELETAQARGDADKVAARYLKEREGSWGKYIMFGLLGMGSAARAEGERLGLYNTNQAVVMKDGSIATLEMRPDGVPVSGYVQDIKGGARNMTASELVEYAGEGSTGKTKPDTSLQTYEKTLPDGTTIKGRVVTSYDKNNRPTTYVESGGKKYPFDGGWKQERISAQGAIAENQAAVKLRYAGPTAYTESGAKAAGEFNFTHGTNIGYQSQQPGAPLVDLNTGRAVVPDKNGVINVTQTGTPGAGAGAGAGAGGVSNVPPAVIKGQTESNLKYSEKLADSKSTAVGQKATIDRIQTSIDRNPEFWGIDTNNPTWRAFVDVNSTNENRAVALDTLARNLNIPQAKRSEFDQTMNDYRNLQVNAITGSGLSASQTNTERESQRVIGTIGSISDKPAAAKATLEFAKAKIEYTEAKANAWIKARKENPGIDRLEFEANFDATEGEKIFGEANKRMEEILKKSKGSGAGPVAPGGPKEGDTDVSKSGKPIVYRNGKWEYQ